MSAYLCLGVWGWVEQFLVLCGWASVQLSAVVRYTGVNGITVEMSLCRCLTVHICMYRRRGVAMRRHAQAHVCVYIGLQALAFMFWGENGMCLWVGRYLSAGIYSTGHVSDW